MTKPCWDSSAARFAKLLHVQRRGDIGSPRLVGSTRASSAAISVGCSSTRDFLPAPGFRCRPGSSTSRRFSSWRPLRMVRSESPVALATATIPPRPNDSASVAAHRRRPRSSKSLPSKINLLRIHATTFSSGIVVTCAPSRTSAQVKVVRVRSVSPHSVDNPGGGASCRPVDEELLCAQRPRRGMTEAPTPERGRGPRVRQRVSASAWT